MTKIKTVPGPSLNNPSCVCCCEDLDLGPTSGTGRPAPCAAPDTHSGGHLVAGEPLVLHGLQPVGQGDEQEKTWHGHKVCKEWFVKSFLFSLVPASSLSPRFGPKRNSKMSFDHHHPQQNFERDLGLVRGSYLICRPI